VRILFFATPTATQDLGLCGLIRRTGTHIPVISQWDSQPETQVNTMGMFNTTGVTIYWYNMIDLGSITGSTAMQKTGWVFFFDAALKFKFT
jgi:hypothetical protein